MSKEGMPPGLSTEDQLIWQYFHEFPNTTAPVVCAVLYTAVTAAVLVNTVRTRAWYMLVVVLTGLLQVVGFDARAAFLRNPARNLFIIMQCLLIISPVLLAIVNYVTVGKLLARTEAGRGSRLARWAAVAFTISDLLCLCLQGAGGAMLASDSVSTQNTGRTQLLAGLGLQLVFFTGFTALTLHVHRSPKYGYAERPNPMKWVFVCLYATIVLQYIRNIFRVVEFVTGFHGYLATHEVYFYCFDFVPIWLCFLCYAVLHFGFWLGPPRTHTIPPIKQVEAGDVEAAPGVQLGMVNVHAVDQASSERPSRSTEGLVLQGGNYSSSSHCVPHVAR